MALDLTLLAGFFGVIAGILSVVDFFGRGRRFLGVAGMALALSPMPLAFWTVGTICEVRSITFY
jgi:hypothetical protein